ncbi:MAG: YbaB/EbfC family nucleoid-associated protein, partial [Synergistaceae bacterium]|nr:YbaB/EbfC family nucleoid-associated protein [Synergistaceae bacterium]
MNMNAIMKQAKQMQAQMMKIQEKLADERVEATVGGG